MPSLRNNLPLLLIILDGWGIAPPSSANVITQAKTPTMSRLIRAYPAMTIQASGPPVGLRFAEMGNSEVGHANIGAGRVAYQSLPRISKSISDGSFFRNEALISAMVRCKRKRRIFRSDSEKTPKLHIMGIIQDSGVHGHIEHLFALLIMAKELGVKDVYIHAFLDGRDSVFNSGINFVEKITKQAKAIGVGKIATLCGRFYAMDRDNRWDRTQKAYDLMVNRKGLLSNTDARKAIKESYARNVFDEEFEPTVILDKQRQPLAAIEDNDSVIFFNYRADRARQLTKAFVLPEFTKFKRKNYFENLFFVAMTEYEKSLPAEVAFKQETFTNTFGEVISKAGLRQLRLAETEKYAHVTFFFNGLSDTLFPNEDHLLIPSPKVAHYQDTPEMSARELTRACISAITNETHDVFILNFANADMVAHTGNCDATISAIEVLDKCIGELTEVVLSKNGAVVITADHGNAEEMKNLQTGEIDKEHSNNPVPLLIILNHYEGKSLAGVENVGEDLSLQNPQGVLSDVAPTILHLLNIPKPEEMTGVSLI